MRFYDAIIFDFCRILVAFEPDEIAGTLIANPNHAYRVRRAVFSGETWLKMTAGLLSEAGAEARLIADNPGEAEGIRRFFCDYKKFLNPVPAGVALIEKIRTAGYGVYGLTNISLEAWEDALRKKEFLALFDGVVVSAREKLAKPDPAIFERLLSRYALSAERCVFIDTVPVHVETARQLGFDGIHFENHQ